MVFGSNCEESHAKKTDRSEGEDSGRGEFANYENRADSLILDDCHNDALITGEILTFAVEACADLLVKSTHL